MKKLFLIIFFFLLVACSNEVDKELYEKGQEIVQIVYESHENLEPPSGKDADKEVAFWSIYKSPETENFKDKNEEFLYYLGLLSLQNINYLYAVEDKNFEDVKQYDKEFKETLNILEEKFNIKAEK